MAQKGETLVEVKDLCKNFGVTIALSHVDFVVKTGEIRGLIGENGSGKSTVWCLVLQTRMREKTHEHRNIVLNRYSIIYLM